MRIIMVFEEYMINAKDNLIYLSQSYSELLEFTVEMTNKIAAKYD